MRAVKIGLSIAYIFILSACHEPPLKGYIDPPHKGYWAKDGSSIEDFHADAKYCYGKARIGMLVDSKLFAYCMEEDGWHYVKLSP
jgi:hypothetical protein